MNKEEKLYNRIADYFDSVGYEFERDEDGFWFEEYVKDHKWKDIFELMEKYAKLRIEIYSEIF